MKIIYSLPTSKTKAEAVILADGDFPSHDIPLSILNNNTYIVCCDGAINHLAQTDIVPQAIVGDCDSLSIENKNKYKEIVHQIKEQETNDLTKAVKFCIENNMKDIVILGATGKREDHSIANISLLADYIDLVDSVSMVTDYGIFNAIKKQSKFESHPKQQVSLFCFAPTPITTQGLKYPIENRIFTSWWQATLNESEGTIFTVDTNEKIIIFRAF